MAHLVFDDEYLLAELVLAPGESLTPAAIMDLLTAQGVTHGIQAAGIAVASNTVGPARIAVAEGDRPIEGQNARIEPTFETDTKDLAPVIGADDKADFRNLNLVQTVSPGQVIARRVPPVPARTGLTVNGRIMQPHFPKDQLLRAGDGCEVSPDGLSVVATIEGNPYYDGGKFTVRREYVVTGGVNLGSGNINFGGDVRVIGHVQLQMEVRATGNVLIQGSVEGARLVAEGDIVVEGGVRNQSRIEANGNVFLRFIENSKVVARGSLVVQENLLHCDVEVDGLVTVRGAIVGGKVLSRNRGQARTVGSKACTPTAVQVVPVAAVDPELKAIESEHEKVIEQLTRITPRIRDAQRALDDAGRSVAESGELRKMLELASLLKQRDTALEVRKKAFSRPVTIKPRFDVVEVIYPGVSFQLGLARMQFDRQYGSNTLVEDQGSVAMLPLTPK